jgi:ABC-type uncharacterized transport system ATPase subunit
MSYINIGIENKIEGKRETLLEAININKKFDSVKALNNVSINIKKGSFHALLGENGAGKSTLVKCIMGYYQADSGQLLYKNKQHIIANPQQAASLGIGMVYQHFTLIDNMSVAQNIILAKPVLPIVINWKKEISELEKGMATMPFKINLQKKIRNLSAGEKQKVEIIKQLFLQSKLLILDEPTSVLTPAEADEVLSNVHKLTQETGLSVLIITHKFREVLTFADEFTVLRKGELIASKKVSDTNEEEMAELMIGSPLDIKKNCREKVENEQIRFEIKQLKVMDDQGLSAINNASIELKAGEILGVAGVSGNGQRELVEALCGQRAIESGELFAHKKAFVPNRKNMREHNFYCLPEEPLKNACVANLSVAENLVLRRYDQSPFTFAKYFLNRRAIKKNAEALIKQYNIKTSGPAQEIGSLSGGNVQRAVLAREISQEISILIISNPCFGLDFKAVADIRGQIVLARNKGAAVLLLSEDLDEILELSDRITVISDGEFVYETDRNNINLNEIGQYMAGH